MSTIPVTPIKRHALGLPAGSIRATHVLGIIVLVCTIILMPPHPERQPTIPPYLIYLMFLMLGHFFAAHGVTIATRDEISPSPLFLPGGTVRVLIILALVCSIGWKFWSDPQALVDLFRASLDDLKQQPYLPLAILGGFFLGVIVRGMVGHDKPHRAWQDFEAWISLIALVGLCIAALIHLVIQPSTETTLMIPVWDACLGGVLAFYFGERS